MTLTQPGTATTGSPALDEDIRALVARLGPTANSDLLFDIFVAAAMLAQPAPDRLDLKITEATLREMGDAFDAFAPYRDRPKVTMFGSARTRTDDPLYAQARELASQVSALGWMVVTGAGPGIMQAGMEGAGRDMSFGVNIRLPFEQAANPVIAGDTKLVSMKYFFTRKLMLMKESSAFVSLPGGFGTLDETLELLTLQQTGKAVPAPVVLLDVPGGTYWHAWDTFVRDEVASMGLISPEDLRLATITDDVSEARRTLVGFYRNYHSIRWVGSLLVIRLRHRPTDAEVAGLAERFADLCTGGGAIRASGPLAPERADGDEVDLPRLVLPFDIFQMARLHELIDALNELPSLPPKSARA